MKHCKIKGDLRFNVEQEQISNSLLCDFFFQADSKRDEDAQVISFEDISPFENIRCEVCDKWFEDEHNEKIH